MTKDDKIIPNEDLPAEVLVAAYYSAADGAEEAFAQGKIKEANEWLLGARRFFASMLKRREEPAIAAAICELEALNGVEIPAHTPTDKELEEMIQAAPGFKPIIH